MTSSVAVQGRGCDRHPEALQVKVLESPAELVPYAAAWNQLWERSGCAPSNRAELIAGWVQQFAPHSIFRALVVCRPNGTLCAALPLIERKLPGGFRVGTTTCNHHTQQSGDLLADASCDLQQVAGLLAAAMRQLPWSALWLRLVAFEALPWRAIRDACRRQGRSESTCRTHSVGVIRFPTRWDDYQAALPGNHRRHMRKADRRAKREGKVELRVERPRDAEAVATLLRRGFDVEHRSWKGRRGSSVIGNDDIYQYFLREATGLAAAGLLQLVFLERDGQPIAFEYGCFSRDTYYTPKVGYDEQHAQLSPSQLLRNRLYEWFYQQGVPPRVDFAGPLSAATARWANETYPVGHLFVSVKGLTGPLIGAGFRTWCGWKRLRARGREEPQGGRTASQIGAAAPE